MSAEAYENGVCMRGPAFDRFHASNPEVFEYLVSQARKYKEENGRNKIGVSLIIAKAWMDFTCENKDGGKFKSAAAFSPYYARLIMKGCPDLDGMFSLRVSEADNWPSVN